MEFNWFDHIFALLILIVIPVMSVRSDKMTPELKAHLPPKKHLYFTNGLMLIIGALLVITSWNVSNKPWTSLGFSGIKSDSLVWLCSIAIVIFYLADLAFSYLNKDRLKSHMDDMQYLVPLYWHEFLPYIFLALSAGICEEIVFRGFLVTYIFYYTSFLDIGHWTAIVCPAIVFSLSHVYQGWWAVLKIFIISLLFGTIFFFSGSLIIVMVLHIFIDLMSGITSVLAHKNENE